MENSPSLRNRGPRGVQQLFLWTLWTNSTTSNDASMILGRTRVLLSDPFEGQVGIWGYGASCISFSQFCVHSMKRWKGNIARSWNWTMMLADVYGQEEGCNYNIMSGYRFWRCLWNHFLCQKSFQWQWLLNNNGTLEMFWFNYLWIWVTPCLSQ